MSMWSTLTLMNESFLQDQTPGSSMIFVIFIMIRIFSLVELIKEVDDGESSSFGILVTFYLSSWKVLSSFGILVNGICRFMTTTVFKVLNAFFKFGRINL